MLVVKALLSYIFLAFFAFLIAKIAILDQQLVKPVIYIYFGFFAYKNYNMS